MIYMSPQSKISVEAHTDRWGSIVTPVRWGNRIEVTMYLLAIIIANLMVVYFGPSISILNAFFN